MKTQNKNMLSNTKWLVKSNVLNEIRHSKMTISQARLFSIYLSKIDPKDISSREVSFKLDEYAKIMEFQRFNITQFRKTASDLLRLSITPTTIDPDDDLTNKDNPIDFTATSKLIFNQCKIYRNDDGEWIVNINCHDDVLPLMFELKSHFFKYQLWNALQLTGLNQQRMYELLKQYEYAGAREISVKDLRDFLGLQDEYADWGNFRRHFLASTQEALLNHSDIKFTWEPSGKRGPGGKVYKMKFNIEKNENYQRQTTLEKFLSNQDPTDIEEEPKELVNDTISFLCDACADEFNPEEITILHNIMVKFVPHSGTGTASYDLDLYDYLANKYKELKLRATKTDIKNRFAYIQKIILADLAK